MPGVVLLVGVAAVYDVLAKVYGWEYISQGIRRIRQNEVGRMAYNALRAHFER